tara:strand:- start:331 stop:690 length:360 start_codon:yes stop_codon:yes gene_type:complete
MSRFSQPGLDGIPGPTGPAGINASTLMVETEPHTTSYTVTLEDSGKIVAMNGTTLSLFFPLDSDVNFPIGTMIHAYDLGAATFTVAGVAGVTVRNAGTVPQYQMVSVRKRAANMWVMQF